MGAIFINKSRFRCVYAVICSVFPALRDFSAFPYAVAGVGGSRARAPRSPSVYSPQRISGNHWKSLEIWSFLAGFATPCWPPEGQAKAKIPRFSNPTGFGVPAPRHFPRFPRVLWQVLPHLAGPLRAKPRQKVFSPNVEKDSCSRTPTNRFLSK